jgi:hypothetical protein
MSASDEGTTVYVAEADLLLTEELRAFTPADIHVGRIGVYGLQVDHIGVDDGQEVFLMRLRYDVMFDDETPPMLSAEVGLEFRTPGVRVRAAWPEAVTAPRPPERLAVTDRLEFVGHTPDGVGLLDNDVPIPEIFPTVHALGIGSAEIRWRHSEGVRPGGRSGWLVVTAPASCQELEVRVVADHEPASTLGMHARGKPDIVFVRLPHRHQSLHGLRYRIGFTVDIVGYSSRMTEAQQAAQHRLFAVLKLFADAVGIAFDPTSFQPTGDGYHYFLPDIDAHAAMRHLVQTMPRLLQEDNAGHDDRIRLRMAVDIGPVEPGELGFGGPTVVRFYRMVDSEQIHEAMKKTDTTIAIIVSDSLYNDVVRQYSDLAHLPFELCDVVVKNYQATAYLLSHTP